MYLLDTSILSEFVRKTPNPLVVRRTAAVAAADLSTSSICVMELRFGAARRPDVVAFWRRLEREVLARVRIETFDDQAALRAGDILAVLEGKGTPIGIEDALIGATALARGLTVVTANTRHFKRIPGLVVEDWTRD